nr:hypothetical protein [Tanacetum cinerariifolium]
MTNAATMTTAPEVVAPHVLKCCFKSSSFAAQIYQVTSEPFHRTTPLILARLVCHDDMIDRLCDQLEDMSLDRMGLIEYDVKTLHARVDVAELRADILHLARGDAGVEIVDLQTPLSATESGAEAANTEGGNVRGAGENARGNAGGIVAPEARGMEQELWNLMVKGDDIAGYIIRFHELEVLCPSMVTPEYKNIERYVWGLLEKIQGNVTSSKPATAHEAIRMTHSLVDQALRFKAARSGKANKRKWEDYQSGGNNNNNNRNNTHHQQQNQRHKAVKTYVVSLAEGKVYLGNLPPCNRCKLHHLGQCSVKCRKCKRLGHQTKDC